MKSCMGLVCASVYLVVLHNTQKVVCQSVDTFQDDQDLRLDGSGDDNNYLNHHNYDHNRPSSKKHNISRNYDDYYRNRDYNYGRTTDDNGNYGRNTDDNRNYGRNTDDNRLNRNNYYSRNNNGDRGRKNHDDRRLYDSTTSYDDEDYDDLGSGDDYIDEHYDDTDYNTDYNTDDFSVVDSSSPTTTTSTTTTTTTTPLPPPPSTTTTTPTTATPSTTSTSSTTTQSPPTSILEENGIYSTDDEKRRNYHRDYDDNLENYDDDEYAYEDEYDGEYDDEYYDEDYEDEHDDDNRHYEGSGAGYDDSTITDDDEDRTTVVTGGRGQHGGSSDGEDPLTFERPGHSADVTTQHRPDAAATDHETQTDHNHSTSGGLPARGEEDVVGGSPRPTHPDDNGDDYYYDTEDKDHHHEHGGRREGGILVEEEEFIINDFGVVSEGGVRGVGGGGSMDGSVQIVTHKEDDRQVSIFAQPGMLAAFIGGAVVGLLCAILLVMFVVYRMRKKDEGSYPLDEPKRLPLTSSYATTDKEIYA